MKKILVTATVVFTALSIHAQGVATFANSTSQSPIRHGDNSTQPAGTLVTGADNVLVGLYWAPLSDPDNFKMIGASVRVGAVPPVPGFFSGGSRTTGTETAPGGEARFQVNAWSAAYATYELALESSDALVGHSDIFQGVTGNPPLQPATPINSMGFAGLEVNIVPEPSVLALGLLGAGALLLLRRRK